MADPAGGGIGPVDAGRGAAEGGRIVSPPGASGPRRIEGCFNAGVARMLTQWKEI